MAKKIFSYAVVPSSLAFQIPSHLFQAFGLGHAGEALTKKLRLESFRNLLRQDIGFYDDIRHGTGKLCTRFATDAPNVRYVSGIQDVAFIMNRR